MRIGGKVTPPQIKALRRRSSVARRRPTLGLSGRRAVVEASGTDIIPSHRNMFQKTPESAGQVRGRAPAAGDAGVVVYTSIGNKCTVAIN